MSQQSCEIGSNSVVLGLPAKFEKLDEDYYKADLEILNRYQSFTGDLLRISMAGIAALGYFIAYALKHQQGPIVWGLLTVAGLLFMMSAVCAMGQRFWSTKGFSHHIRYLRLYPVKPGGSKANDHATDRKKHYDVASRLFTLATAFCALAALSVAGAWVAMSPDFTCYFLGLLVACALGASLFVMRRDSVEEDAKGKKDDDVTAAKK